MRFVLAALKFDMHLMCCQTAHACTVLQQKSFEFVSAFSVLTLLGTDFRKL